MSNSTLPSTLPVTLISGGAPPPPPVHFAATVQFEDRTAAVPFEDRTATVQPEF